MVPKKITVKDKTYWEIRFEVGTEKGRKQTRRRFSTEREAKTELARIKHEQNEGIYVHPSKSMTVNKLAEAWTAATARALKPTTVRHYSDALKPLLERHGDLLVVKLTSRHLVKLSDDMLSGSLRRIGTKGKPLSARSVNSMLGAVSSLLEYGVHERVVPRNVATPRSTPRVADNRIEDNNRRTGWQNEHLLKFRVAAADHRLCGSLMLTSIGLRRGEVLGLKWSDIDWEAGSVTVRQNRVYVAGADVLGTPKSKASRRTLIVDGEVMDALMCQRAAQEQTDADGWVTADVAGRPIRQEWYSDEFGRVVAAASLPPITLHGARHAAASLMASKNIPLAAIAKWLGQDQTTMHVTLGYTHAQDSDGDAIRAAFGG